METENPMNEIQKWLIELGDIEDTRPVLTPDQKAIEDAHDREWEKGWV